MKCCEPTYISFPHLQNVTVDRWLSWETWTLFSESYHLVPNPSYSFLCSPDFIITLPYWLWGKKLLKILGKLNQDGVRFSYRFSHPYLEPEESAFRYNSSHRIYACLTRLCVKLNAKHCWCDLEYCPFPLSLTFIHCNFFISHLLNFIDLISQYRTDLMKGEKNNSKEKKNKRNIHS